MLYQFLIMQVGAKEEFEAGAGSFSNMTLTIPDATGLGLAISAASGETLTIPTASTPEE